MIVGTYPRPLNLPYNTPIDPRGLAGSVICQGVVRRLTAERAPDRGGSP